MKMALIGCGNMGGAILSRWLGSGALDATDVTVAESDEGRAAAVANAHGVATSTDGPGVVQGADVVMLGVKPQVAQQVVQPLIASVPTGQPWISMLAGVQASKVRRWLGNKPTVVRIMPNTPARVGLGCTAVAWPAALETPVRDAIKDLLVSLGEVVELEEDRIDGFTAIAGSGPAYVFRFLEALADAAREQGFDEEQAATMALATVRGAAQLAAEDDRSFSALRVAVTSPGGTTAEALRVLSENRWSTAVSDAANAAVARAVELAKV